MKEVMWNLDYSWKGKDQHRKWKVQHENLDRALYKLYVQERTEGVTVYISFFNFSISWG